MSLSGELADERKVLGGTYLVLSWSGSAHWGCVQEAGGEERRPFKFSLGGLFRSCSGQPESMSYLLVGGRFIDVCGDPGNWPTSIYSLNQASWFYELNQIINYRK